MQLNKIISILTILLTVLFACGMSKNVNGQTNPFIKAIQLFDNGNYTQSEKILYQLLKKQPDNLMVNYYYGACRTENKYYGPQEIACLLKASKTESPLKTDFYLGEQYHAQENWEQAIKYYNRYKLKTKQNNTEDKEVLDRIQQCFNNENPFDKERITLITAPSRADTIVQLAAQIDTAKNPTIDTTVFIPKNDVEITSENKAEILDTLNPNNRDTLKLPDEITNVPLFVSDTMPTDMLQPEIENEQIIPKKDETTAKPIKFIVNSRITYTRDNQFKTPEGKFFFEKSDSINREIERSVKKADELRIKYNKTKSRETKNVIGNEIVALENNSYLLKDKYSMYLQKANDAENNYWQKATEQEIQNFVTSIKQIDDDNEINTDTISTDSDSSVYIDPTILLGPPGRITKEEKKEDELIYKIQIGAYSRGVPAYMKRVFKKLSYLRKIDNYTDEKGVVVYTTGNLTNINDAITMQNQVRQEGVEDAFVVPYFNGKRITLKQAKEIEEKK